MTNKKSNHASRSGFTLIELVVVIGILAVLLTIVLVAINPSRQFKQANDTKRKSDVNAILNAVHQYSAEHKGDLSPLGIGSSAAYIADNSIDICEDLVPDYISALPKDPLQSDSQVTDCTATYNTHYQILKDTDGRVTVIAPDTEVATTDISITR